MAPLFALVDKIPLLGALVICATLGLAPVMPEPHVWEKLKMLAAGDLHRAVDMFDLLFHGAPWLVLMVKLLRGARTSS